jgi:RsiW-degrading membrane proteinase PrsW (M82 family)
MSEIHITVNGGLYRYGPGVVRIGRSSENDIVINDPTVSRRHAQISLEADGWTWQNLGQAPTFLSGQPVARFVVADLVDISLASPQGPSLRLQAVPDAPPAAAAPIRAVQEAQGAVAPPANIQAGPGYPAAAAAAAGAAVAGAAPAGAFPAGVGVPAAPGYPVGPGGPAGPGYPGAPGSPGGPGYSGAPAGPGPGRPQQPGFTPAAGGGQGYPAPPGMPGFPGFGPGAPQLDATKLERGSFFETMVPIKSWLHDKGWRQGFRLLIIPYALLPLLFLQVFAMSKSLQTPGWAYSLYVAPLWLIAFWYLIRPPRWGKAEVWIAVGVVIWEYIWLHVVTININDHAVGRGPLTFPKALIVGFNEETSKAIPVLVAAALLLSIRKQKLDPRSWMIMGTIAGLTFGVIEQSLYTPQALVTVANAARGGGIPQADFGALEFAFRVFVDGFQHAVWAGISGFFIGMAINYRRRRVPILLLGISIPAVLHALNDWTLTIFSTVWVTVFLVQGLSLLLFLGYTLSASDIERRVRRNPAFRGQSIIMERFSQP